MPILIEVQMGEERLKLYCYGQELYEDMLAAIDSAHESVYLRRISERIDERGGSLKTLMKKAGRGCGCLCHL